MARLAIRIGIVALAILAVTYSCIRQDVARTDAVYLANAYVAQMTRQVDRANEAIAQNVLEAAEDQVETEDALKGIKLALKAVELSRDDDSEEESYKAKAAAYWSLADARYRWSSVASLQNDARRFRARPLALNYGEREGRVLAGGDLYRVTLPTPADGTVRPEISKLGGDNNVGDEAIYVASQDTGTLYLLKPGDGPQDAPTPLLKMSLADGAVGPSGLAAPIGALPLDSGFGVIAFRVYVEGSDAPRLVLMREADGAAIEIAITPAAASAALRFDAAAIIGPGTVVAASRNYDQQSYVLAKYTFDFGASAEKFKSAGEKVVAAGRRLWTIDAQLEGRVGRGSGHSFERASLDPRGKRAALYLKDRFMIVDLETLNEIGPCGKSTDEATGVRFLADGKVLAYRMERDNAVEFHDPSSPDCRGFARLRSTSAGSFVRMYEFGVEAEEPSGARRLRLLVTDSKDDDYFTVIELPGAAAAAPKDSEAEGRPVRTVGLAIGARSHQSPISAAAYWPEGADRAESLLTVGIDGKIDLAARPIGALAAVVLEDPIAPPASVGKALYARMAGPEKIAAIGENGVGVLNALTKDTVAAISFESVGIAPRDVAPVPGLTNISRSGRLAYLGDIYNRTTRVVGLASSGASSSCVFKLPGAVGERDFSRELISSQFLSPGENYLVAITSGNRVFYASLEACAGESDFIPLEFGEPDRRGDPTFRVRVVDHPAPPRSNGVAFVISNGVPYAFDLRENGALLAGVDAIAAYFGEAFDVSPPGSPPGIAGPEVSAGGYFFEDLLVAENGGSISVLFGLKDAQDSRVRNRRVATVALDRDLRARLRPPSPEERPGILERLERREREAGNAPTVVRLRDLEFSADAGALFQSRQSNRLLAMDRTPESAVIERGKVVAESRSGAMLFGDAFVFLDDFLLLVGLLGGGDGPGDALTIAMLDPHAKDGRIGRGENYEARLSFAQGLAGLGSEANPLTEPYAAIATAEGDVRRIDFTELTYERVIEAARRQLELSGYGEDFTPEDRARFGLPEDETRDDAANRAKRQKLECPGAPASLWLAACRFVSGGEGSDAVDQRCLAPYRIFSDTRANGDRIYQSLGLEGARGYEANCKKGRERRTDEES